MSDHDIDLVILGERLVRVRSRYGKSIGLPNLGTAAFATLLGVSLPLYASCERGEREPTVGLLVALRHTTGISLDWFLDPNQPEANERHSNPVG